MGIDYRGIKASYSLQDIAPQLLQQAAGKIHGSGPNSYMHLWHDANTTLGHHGGHDVSTPSLAVYPDKVHCLTPDTPVLMADFSWCALGELMPGDRIVSFDEESNGLQRCTRIGTVLATKRSIANVAKVVTDQGELVSTQDHLWLVARGNNSHWRSTAKLKPGNLIRQIIPYIPQIETDEYVRGYIAGITDGDGTMRYDPFKGNDKWVQYWRVALTDREPLERLKTYLKRLGIVANIRIHSSNGGRLRGKWITPRKYMSKIEVRNMGGLAVIAGEMQWDDSIEFARGYLAGIFDAEGGCYTDGNLCVACGKETSVINRVEKAIILAGFEQRPKVTRDNGMAYIYLKGNRREKMRFMAITRPAIRRKLEQAIGYAHPWGSNSATVLSISDSGMQEIVEIAIDTQTMVARGLASHNCYGCGYHGDLFDFVRDVEHMDDDRQVVEFLTGRRFQTSEVTLAARKRTYEIEPPFPLSKMGAWTTMTDDEKAKWHARGFDDATIAEWRLGYFHGDHPLYAHRLVIPYRNHIGLYGAKLRRDDEWAWSDMMGKGDEFIAEQLHALQEKRLLHAFDPNTVKDPSLQDLLEELYPRYVFLKGTKVWLLGEDGLMQKQPYGFLTSSETDAIAIQQALRNELGVTQQRVVCWPADAAFPEVEDVIRFKWNSKWHEFNIRRIFRNWAALFIVADNDPSGIKSGIKRRTILDRGEVIQTPAEKDPNAFFMNGGTLKKWLPHLPR